MTHKIKDAIGRSVSTVWTPELLDRAIALRNEGKSYTEMGAILGMHRSCIHVALKRRGLDGIGRIAGGQKADPDSYFWDNVTFEPNSGCWLWTGHLNTWGYGAWLSGELRMAHRVVYEREVGPIPDGLQLDHLCRTRCCVNPSHLEPVTCIENIRRATPFRKRPTNCKRCDRELVGENVYINPANGGRTCRHCNNLSKRKRDALKGG